MLLPGTFLGVWNLISISAKQAAAQVSAAWLQAHGHAQVFGWIGSFILGIGFYSIPKLLRARGFALWGGWVCWALWITGVALRWIANVYAWYWRALLPISAVLELCAFLLFFMVVARHRAPGPQEHFDSWVLVVITGTIGLGATLLLNVSAALYLGLYAASPAFPHELDQRFLILAGWGFIVPFVWGFSARWMLIFLGLPALRERALLMAAGMNSTGVALALAGLFRAAVVLILAGAVLAVAGLRMFEPAKQPPRHAVHISRFLTSYAQPTFGCWSQLGWACGPHLRGATRPGSGAHLATRSPWDSSLLWSSAWDNACCLRFPACDTSTALA
jgi:uncharacterized protein involved in response to NO